MALRQSKRITQVVAKHTWVKINKTITSEEIAFYVPEDKEANVCAMFKKHEQA